MPLEAREREIGGRQYKVEQLPLKPARAALVRLTRILGQPMSALLEASGAKSLGDVDVAIVGKAVQLFTSTLEDSDLDFLTETFAASSFVALESRSDGSPAWVPLKPALDVVFRGRLTDLFTWLWFAIETNYADFFTAAGSLFPKFAPAPAQSQSPSPGP